MPNLIYKLTGKEPAALFTDATAAAKTRISSNIAQNAANNPSVRADIKAGVGQKIGVWLINNYLFILAGVAVIGGAWFFLKRK